MTADDRRQQILTEATRLIGQRGYFGFSIMELAEQCGLSNAGLLHHVGTKHQLLTAVLESRDQRDIEAAKDLIDVLAMESAEGPVSISIDDAITLLHSTVARNATQPEIVRLYSVLRSESLFEDHPSHQFFRDRDERALGVFRRLFESSVPNPASFARHILALMGGLEEQWLRSPGTVDLVAEWDRGIAALIAGSTSAGAHPTPGPKTADAER